jgi:alpha-amylase
VEPIGIEPYHSFLFLIDIERFIERMQWARDQLSEFAGKPVRLTDTTEMFMSNDLYYALMEAGFEGVMMDGRDWVMEWRQASYLYHAEPSPKIFCRHYSLSDDVGLRFSDRNWEFYPLSADMYASWIGEAMGDMIFLAWDFETFGERHSLDSGIFEFMRGLPESLKVRGVVSMTPSQAMDELKDESRSLHLPAFPCTWAGNGGAEFFVGKEVQNAVFQLMHHAYNKAQLTRNSELLDLATWLLMSDNLLTRQWWQPADDKAEVSYFRPRAEWSSESSEIVSDLQDVYKYFIQACDAHIPKKA